MRQETLLKKLEATYEEAKKAECEELHNALAEVMSEQKPSIQNALFVLELLRFELLQRKHKEISES